MARARRRPSTLCLPPGLDQPESAMMSVLSVAYIVIAIKICLLLLRSMVRCARSLAFAKAGKSMAARMAMIAMTARSSINVNAARLDGGLCAC